MVFGGPICNFSFHPVFHNWLSYLWDGTYKRSLDANWKVALEVVAVGFLSYYKSGSEM